MFIVTVPPNAYVVVRFGCEAHHENAAIMTQLAGEDSLFMDGIGAMTNPIVLMHRGMSIAGGTSEIKRNQIGERILGLPRDPLIN